MKTREKQRAASDTATRETVLASPKLPGRAVITGGAGFIGTNLAASLVEAGCAVTVFDNLSREGVQRNLNWLCKTYDGRVNFVRGDIRDADAVRQVVANCDAVFHLAAQVAVTTSLEDPELDFAINAGGTLNLLEACRAMDAPPKLLFTSTNKVFGNLTHVSLERKENKYQPTDRRLRKHGIDEACPLDFHSPYGCSKGTADQYVIDYARCWNLPAVVFRMSCIYGPHQCGTEDQGWVAHFARSILEDREIVIYGDGLQVRDLLYVDDLVAAMTKAVTQMQAARGKAFNVGGGPTNAVSVQEVIGHIARFTESEPAVRMADWREGDQRYYVSDCRRIADSLGWRPRVSVEAGLKRMLAWMKTQRLRMPVAG